jgi:hypothetical protein
MGWQQVPPEDVSRHGGEGEAEAGVNTAVITEAPPASFGRVVASGLVAHAMMIGPAPCLTDRCPES